MDSSNLNRQRNDLFRKCADECTTNAELCIENDLYDCAALCRQSAAACYRVVAEGGHNPAVYEACAHLCNACATECEKHQNARNSHCAAICRECVDECKRWLCRIEIFNSRNQPVFV